MKKLPFAVKPRLEIVPVGNPEIGIIHLLKKGGTSPNEDPIDLQEAGTRQAKAMLITEKAIKRLMEQESCSKAEARKRLFAAPVRDAESGEDSEPEESMYDYLSIEESTELLSLRDNQVDIAIRVATLFIRYRVAYPVQLSATAKPKADKLYVEPLPFSLAEGDRIRFDAFKVEITSSAEEGEEAIAIKPNAPELKRGAIGYLLNENGQEKLGSPDWEEADTRLLTEELIAAIYAFYRMEKGGIPDLQEGSEEVGENLTLKPSNSSQIERRSTGENSSGDYNTSELQTNGSTPKTLATAPTG